MSLGVRLLPEAKTEFDAATDWYENQRAGLGISFVATVRQVLERIADDPQRHAPVHLDIRKALVPKFGRDLRKLERACFAGFARTGEILSLAAVSSSMATV
jgi:hypothetical protein